MPSAEQEERRDCHAFVGIDSISGVAYRCGSARLHANAKESTQQFPAPGALAAPAGGSDLLYRAVEAAA